jgi:hypothetical protein
MSQKLIDSCFYVTSAKDSADCHMPSNPLLNPKLSVEEANKLAFMTPRQREKYEQSKESKRKKAQAAQTFLCSCLLAQETHDLLQHYALEKGITYDQAVFRAVKHAMSCFAEPHKGQE